MKKKLLVTIITSVFVLSLMGCGASQEAPASQETETTVEAEAPSVNTEEVAATEEVKEEVTEEAVVEEAAEEVVEEVAEEVVEEEAVPEVETILTKYGLEITHLNGACYEDTFQFGEFNKDDKENAIMDNYQIFDAPCSACISEVDNGDGTKTVEVCLEVGYKDWGMEFNYNHYDIVLVDLTTSDILSNANSIIWYNDAEYTVHGNSETEYTEDYTFGTTRFTVDVPSDYDNYALYMRDLVVRDRLLSSFDQFKDVSSDEHYVLLQN